MVDPATQRKILVVHGVETGTNTDQRQDRDIRTIIERSLQASGAELDFGVDLYAYEDLNDEAKQKYEALLHVLLTAIAGPPAAWAVDKIVDVVGDVVISLTDDSTAHAIREGLQKRILKYFADGHPLYIVAHSLGSIYSFDVINELIRANAGRFQRSQRLNWPVWGLMTLGSPIGLKMFGGRQTAALPGAGLARFPWLNYWDPLDPVVSGSVIGAPETAEVIAEAFQNIGGNWLIRDRRIDSGKQWLAAHTSYWKLPEIGDELASWLAS